MKLNKRAFGSSGEQRAIEYLKSSGYEIITVNYRYGRLGEIDIIARDGEYICFVEVKTRSSTAYGTPAEAVTRRKQDRIKKLAQIFISQNSLYDINMRFDIIEIFISKDINGSASYINLIKNAF
ncbi:MAG TPA: YraN family protein [Clostridiaceae bacterium]|nr:YraN family protein [Clostridiaceae bacterium]